MKIIFYDGACGLCNSSVEFINKRAPQGVFTYVAIGSDEGQEFLKTNTGRNTVDPNTFYYWNGDKLFQRSEAACRVGMLLKNPLYRLLSRFILLLPEVVRDGAYNVVARRRHHLGGSCDLQ